MVENLRVFRTSFSENICLNDITLVLPFVCELGLDELYVKTLDLNGFTLAI